MNSQLNILIRQIEQKLPAHDTVEAAANDVLADFKDMGVTVDDAFMSLLGDAIKEVHARLGPIEILRRNSIIKPREQWYHGPSPRDMHWPALREYLLNTKGWGKDAVDSIDNSSTEVVSLLANPKREQFRYRGLVVGHVQSGKTANMTAVIAKAVDAGYNLVIVLAGVTNKLRAQTHARIEQDVARRHRHNWQLYTGPEEDEDFVVPANRSFVMPRPGMAQLVVMKKVVSRLKALHQTIKGTPPKILQNLKVLLLDDECDQASVNAARDEFDMTKINKVIRRIIRDLPAVSYAGYTATPFANVFINPFPHNAHELDDLYPEDFITALPRPENYFGTKEVFGDVPEDADDGADSGRNMIRIITDDLSYYRPSNAADRSSFAPRMGKDLSDAILWFLATCAIRRLRGQVDKHMTMLIHTTASIEPHNKMAALIKEWLASVDSSLRTGSGTEHDRLLELLEEESTKVPPSAAFPSKDKILPVLGEALDALEVVVENSVSPLRLEYDAKPRTYIVVGGSVLSRGLTLEGLSVSFFLRISRQYDTLLQMGRWFGYRQGYEDLPRLWTTADLAADFRALAAIEEEIREEIARYRENDATPMDFAVRVRAIPGMAITSATKMRHAHRTSISFDGRHVQTIRFEHRDADTVVGNWKAAARLVSGITKYRAPGTDALLFTGVSYSAIWTFLGDYRISNAHMDLKEEMLRGYLEAAHERLPAWNVGIITAEDGPLSDQPLGPLGPVKTVRRAQLINAGAGFADIKALMSKRDILIDAADMSFTPGEKWEHLKLRRPRVPLLLLYPINKVSEPRPGSKTRTRLDAVGDLIGIGIVFPGQEDKSGNYYSVQLDAISAEDIDTEETEVTEADL